MTAQCATCYWANGDGSTVCDHCEDGTADQYNAFPSATGCSGYREKPVPDHAREAYENLEEYERAVKWDEIGCGCEWCVLMRSPGDVEDHEITIIQRAIYAATAEDKARIKELERMFHNERKRHHLCVGCGTPLPTTWEEGTRPKCVDCGLIDKKET